MELYFKKRRWKILLLLGAVIIGAASLGYTNWLVKRMAAEEHKNVKIWKEAMNLILNSDEDLFLPSIIIDNNNNIPIIVTDSLDNILIDKNIGNRENEMIQITEYDSLNNTIVTTLNIPVSDNNRIRVLEKELEKMKDYAPAILLNSEFPGTETQLLYYRESWLLRNLRLFPIVQLAVIVLFILVSYFAFSSSRKAEQNQVWVGMSKETAHQLGTPISSLLAWIELLKMQDVKEEIISEFEKDIQRLEKITERFSKIGSAPELLRDDLRDVIISTINYLESRSSKKVQFSLDFDQDQYFFVPHNTALFSWVIENLCKNAIDAIDSKGMINLHLFEKGDLIVLDVTDTGKGIPKGQHKTIFEPGFTTKKRGWGLGLSLAKRIIESYHKGKIFIKNSEPGNGTTFRITLPKA